MKGKHSNNKTAQAIFVLLEKHGKNITPLLNKRITPELLEELLGNQDL